MNPLHWPLSVACLRNKENGSYRSCLESHYCGILAASAAKKACVDWAVPSDAAVLMGGVGDSKYHWLRREVKVFFLPGTDLSCPAGHSCLPHLAQFALQMLHQCNITLKPSSLVHSHCCSLLCYFR